MQEGFYFKDVDNSLIYASTEVCDASFHLVKEDHLSYQYPINGWYWFDSLQEAESFFNV